MAEEQELQPARSATFSDSDEEDVIVKKLVARKIDQEKHGSDESDDDKEEQDCVISDDDSSVMHDPEHEISIDSTVCLRLDGRIGKKRWIRWNRVPFQYIIDWKLLVDIQQKVDDVLHRINSLNLRNRYGQNEYAGIRYVKFTISRDDKVSVLMALEGRFVTVYDVIKNVEAFLSMPITRKFQQIIDEYPDSFPILPIYVPHHQRGSYLRGAKYINCIDLLDDGTSFIDQTGERCFREGGLLLIQSYCP